MALQEARSAKNQQGEKHPGKLREEGELDSAEPQNNVGSGGGGGRSTAAAWDKSVLYWSLLSSAKVLRVAMNSLLKSFSAIFRGVSCPGFFLYNVLAVVI